MKLTIRGANEMLFFDAVTLSNLFNTTETLSVDSTTVYFFSLGVKCKTC